MCFDGSTDPATYVTSVARLKNLPGIAVVVGAKQEFIWSFGYGAGSVSEGTKIEPGKTQFRIGSVSKALTSFAIAKLVEDGRMDIDTSVRKQLPDLPPSYDAVTVRQLAGHLAGVRHYAGNSELGSTVEYPSSRSALQIFVDDPLLSSPGSEFSYSTYGYTVISAALEEITAMPFLGLMASEVFEPLGMTHTVADTTSVNVPARTEFYYLDSNDTLTVGPPINSSYKWAGGGILSTAADLARFGMAHLNPQHLSEESKNLLWQSQRTADDEETGYGIGWFVDENYVEHPGGTVGGTALLRIYPKQELVVAITANLSMLGPDNFAELPDQLFQCFDSR